MGNADRQTDRMAFCFVKYLARPFKKGTFFSLARTANTPGGVCDNLAFVHGMLTL